MHDRRENGRRNGSSDRSQRCRPHVVRHKDPGSIKAVVAAIGDPASTGLSSIAGRTHPVSRDLRGGVAIELAPDGVEPVRRVRVPLTPGSFDTLAIDDDEPVTLAGPGVLAFDGERDLPIGPETTVIATVSRTGPRLIDVLRTIAIAANAELFDVPSSEGVPDGH